MIINSMLRKDFKKYVSLAIKHLYKTPFITYQVVILSVYSSSGIIGSFIGKSSWQHSLGDLDMWHIYFDGDVWSVTVD